MEPHLIGRRYDMALPDEVERDLSSIDVPRWGRVLRVDELATWQVEVPPVQRTVGPAYSGVRAGVPPSSR